MAANLVSEKCRNQRWRLAAHMQYICIKLQPRYSAIPQCWLMAGQLGQPGGFESCVQLTAAGWRRNGPCQLSWPMAWLASALETARCRLAS